MTRAPLEISRTNRVDRKEFSALSMTCAVAEFNFGGTALNWSRTGLVIWSYLCAQHIVSASLDGIVCEGPRAM